MSENTQYKNIAEILIRTLKLKTYPISIKLLKKSDKLYDKITKKNIETIKNTTLCQMIGIARYYHKAIYAESKSFLCVFGASAIGFIKTPERVISGNIILNRYSDNKNAAKKFQSSIYKLGNYKLFDLILVSPLDLTFYKPDVIIIYGDVPQISRIIHAFSTKTGEGLKTHIHADVGICSTVAYVYDFKKPYLDFPCAGERYYGGTQDNEIFIGLPSSYLLKVLNGFKFLNKTMGDFYPYKPFLDFIPKMPKKSYYVTEDDYRNNIL